LAGIARTFQNPRLFRGLSVLENVMTALDPVAPYSFWESLLPFPRKIRTEKKIREKAVRFLELVGLVDYQRQKPENLPYGLQRRLEIARALALEPKLMLLDEPAAGLNPQEIVELNQLIRNLNVKYGLSLVIIEHRMEVIMELCQRIYVQNFGRTLAVGTPVEIQQDENVIRAYLGEEE